VNTHLYHLTRPHGSVRYDQNDALIVRATSEAHARNLAAEFVRGAGVEPPEVWLDASRSDCVPIPLEGESCVIQSSFRAG
jgi:hypothetical protein